MKTTYLWLITGVYLLVAAVMFAVLLPATTAACGGPPLDGRFWWDAHTAAELAVACGPDGLRTYSHLQTGDLVYPAVLATTLIAWTTWLAPRLGLHRRWTVTVVAAAATNAVFDYLENIAAWTLVRTGEATSWVFTVGGGFSLVKNLTGALAITSVVVLAVWYVATARTRRAAHQPSEEQEPGLKRLYVVGDFQKVDG
ncbi:MAG: hypothetical protein FWD11_08545 [Micrococcales bacterium]|nr:hypothetical protein [Micrococcales bacterium]